MHTIAKTFEFSASHQLAGLASDHKCARLHGHSYAVRLELTGEIDSIGFVVDFGELAWFGSLIASTLDHRHLNDVLELNPTSENLASWLLAHVTVWLGSRPEAERIVEARVVVSESRTTFASVGAALK